jgi:hypothetical protein
MECIYPKRPTLQEAIDMLEAVGGPDAIAAHLDRMDIKAERGCTENCGAARFYRMVADPDVNLEVCPVDSGQIGEIVVEPEPYEFEYLPLPINTNWFANDFDEGKYPELVHGWDGGNASIV